MRNQGLVFLHRSGRRVPWLRSRNQTDRQRDVWEPPYLKSGEERMMKTWVSTPKTAHVMTLGGKRYEKHKNSKRLTMIEQVEYFFQNHIIDQTFYEMIFLLP